VSAKRGLIVTNLFPNSAEPARGTFVRQEVESLSRRYALKVIAPIPWVPSLLKHCPKYAYHSVPEVECLDGIEVHHPRHVVIPGHLQSSYGPLLYHSLSRAVKRLRKSFDPEFVIAYYAYPDGWAAQRLARKLDVPVIVKALGSDINLFTRNPRRRRMTVASLNRADRVVAVSRALASRMTELGVDTAHTSVMENGVDTQRFHPMERLVERRRLDLEEEPFTFLFVGTLREIKGVRTLLEAFHRQPPEWRKRVRLLMVGSGELRSELEQTIQRHQLGDSVRLLGSLPHNEIPHWIGACDCLLLPSLMEGSPNVLAEARACRRPVVASRVGGIPDIVVEGRTGLLIEPDDAEALRLALQKMSDGFNFDDPRQSMQSWHDVARETEMLIESACDDFDLSAVGGRHVA